MTIRLKVMLKDLSPQQACEALMRVGYAVDADGELEGHGEIGTGTGTYAFLVSPARGVVEDGTAFDPALHMVASPAQLRRYARESGELAEEMQRDPTPFDAPVILQRMAFLATMLAEQLEQRVAAEKAEDVYREMMARPLPCGHKVEDLVGGTDPSTGLALVTKCGACLAARSAATQEAQAEARALTARQEGERARSLLREISDALARRGHFEEAEMLTPVSMSPIDLSDVGDMLIEFLPTALAAEIPEDLREQVREALGVRRAELEALPGAQERAGAARELEALLGGETIPEALSGVEVARG